MGDDERRIERHVRLVLDSGQFVDFWQLGCRCDNDNFGLAVAICRRVIEITLEATESICDALLLFGFSRHAKSPMRSGTNSGLDPGTWGIRGEYGKKPQEARHIARSAADHTRCASRPPSLLLVKSTSAFKL